MTIDVDNVTFSSFSTNASLHEAGTRPPRTAVDTLVILMGLTSLPRIAQTLIAHGRRPETPVALVRHGTTRAQETIVGTLGDIATRVGRAGFTPPVLAIVGDVVGLRGRLDWPERRRRVRARARRALTP